MSQHVAVYLRDAVPVNTHNLTLAHHRVPSSSVAEHPTRSRRVMGSNPIWDSDFFRVYISPRVYLISHSMIELEFGNGFWGEGKTGVPEKNFLEHGRKPKTNSTHMTLGPGIKPAKLWWEVSALITVPSKASPCKETRQRKNSFAQCQKTWWQNGWITREREISAKF